MIASWTSIQVNLSTWQSVCVCVRIWGGVSASALISFITFSQVQNICKLYFMNCCERLSSDDFFLRFGLAGFSVREMEE